MKLTKIKIENFKSIKELEFDIKKYGSSYTTMLLGINESGKSNVLDAMSFLKKPEGKFDYLDLQNQKDNGSNPIDLWYYLEFEDEDGYIEKLRKQILVGGDFIDVNITGIIKHVYLQRGESEFSESYDFKIEGLQEGLYISDIIIDDSFGADEGPRRISTIKADDSFETLTVEKFKECFNDDIVSIISDLEPSVAYWKPSPEYLISDVDLNVFSQKISANPALRNIFLLAGYEKKEDVQQAVAGVSNGNQRSRLQSKLQDSLNQYIKGVWAHNIDIVIDITETGQLTLSIKDSGKENKHDRLSISGRSEGARHFLSLILSLSIESNHSQRKNQLILIDEPEAHLHPSGIRDLSRELLNIGRNNYLFVSTHSPFLIDKKERRRHIIVRKNKSAITEKIHIEPHMDIIDDEVLREAFGIEVYRDLMSPHRVLVEGSSDKKLLQKAFTKHKEDIGVTNGHGSDLYTLASKLNHDDISILVVVDDDDSGKKHKETIIKIGGVHSKNNVFTIRDLVGDIVSGGTIEDALGKEYVESKFKELYRDLYSKDSCDIQLEKDSPFIPQIKIYLQKQNKKQDVDGFVENLKSKLATDFDASNQAFETKFPLLNLLAKEIINRLQTIKQ